MFCFLVSLRQYDVFYVFINEIAVLLIRNALHLVIKSSVELHF